MQNIIVCNKHQENKPRQQLSNTAAVRWMRQHKKQLDGDKLSQVYFFSPVFISHGFNFTKLKQTSAIELLFYKNLLQLSESSEVS